MAFPSGWARKCAITIAESNIDATLTNFTAVLTKAFLPSEMLDADGSFPALNGGGDIRFSSDSAGATQLACDIRSFVTDNNPANGIADIAVNIPSVSGSVDTVIYVWYNKSGEVQPTTSDTYGRNNAYDSNYLAVYALQEAPGGGSPQFTDRKGNGYNGSTAGNPTSGTGVAGNDIVFDGTGDCISIPDLPSFASDFTISIWAKTSQTTGNFTALAMNSSPYLEIWAGIFGSDSTFSWKAYSGTFVSSVHMQSGVAAGSTFANVAVKRTSGSNALFVNGASTATYSNSETFTNPSPYIGARPGAPPSVNWNGDLDEVRISTAARSDAWLKAEYQNLRTSSNTFATAGTPANGSVFPSGWSRKCAVIIESSNLSGDLTNFTAIMTKDFLPSEMFDADGTYPALSGGGDIRFTSDSAGATRLACDVRTFTIDNNPANGVADIAVKIPALSASVDTTIYVWYRAAGESQPSVTDTYGRNNAYDSNYKLVFGMNEDPSTSAPQFIDRTGNSGNGTSSGSMTSGDSVAGLAGKAIDFDGTNDFIGISSSAIPTGTNPAVTRTAWVYQRTRTDGNQAGLFDQPPVSNEGSVLLMALLGGTVYIFSDGLNGANNLTIAGAEIPGLNAWFHFAFAVDASKNWAYYLNGALKKSGTFGADILLETTAMDVGRRGSLAVGYLDGIMDEVHVSAAGRSAHWIKAEYENLRPSSNTFASAGTPGAAIDTVTGTAAMTEANDTASGSGTERFTGTIAVTEAADTMSAAGKSQFVGTSAITEAADTMAATGTEIFTGTIAKTELNDTMSASGVSQFAGTVAYTEANDTASATGKETFIGTSAFTEAADTMNAAGLLNYSGTAVITEANDTMSGTGLELFTGTMSQTEANDTMAATGLHIEPVSGTSVIAEAPDTMSASGIELINGTSAWTEANDISNAAGLVAFTGSIAITESPDTMSATGLESFTGSMSIMESADVMLATGAESFSGSVIVTESADVMAASGFLKIRGPASWTESADIMTAAGVSQFEGAAAFDEADDTVIATGLVTFIASASIIETNDTMAAFGIIAYFGPAQIQEANDTMIAEGFTPISRQIIINSKVRLECEFNGRLKQSFAIQGSIKNTIIFNVKAFDNDFAYNAKTKTVITMQGKVDLT